jgi:hypothetical protein
MRIAVFAASAAIALSLSVAAYASAYTAVDKAKLLERDFDWVMTLWPTAPNGDQAKQQRAEGADLLAKGSPKEAVAKLLEAFQTIGITPNDYPTAP